MKSLSEYEKRYLEDVDTCIKVLEILKEDYVTPGYATKINTSKVSRVRITVNDLLKKY